MFLYLQRALVRLRARLPKPRPPNSFFYFQPLNSEDRREWLRTLLVDNQIYFRSRAQFNDPNELRPTFVFDGSERQIRRFVRELIQTRSPIPLTQDQFESQVDILTSQYKARAPWVTGIMHDLLDQIGVLCLCGTATRPLMWAHYADGHRGVCVELEAQAGLFLSAQRVIYAKKAPVINRLIDRPPEILEKSMFTKGAAWKYEKEWRVIARWYDAARIEQHIAEHELPPPLEAFMRKQHGPASTTFQRNRFAA
jgi:hypothetical protein